MGDANPQRVILNVEPKMLGTPVAEITVPVQVFGDVGAFGGHVSARVHPVDQPPDGYEYSDGRWTAHGIAAEPLSSVIDEPVVADESAAVASMRPLPGELSVIARDIEGSRITVGGLDWVVSLPATVIGRALEERGIGDPMPQAEAAALLDQATSVLGSGSMASTSPLGGDSLGSSLGDSGKPPGQGRFLYMAIGLFVILIVVAVVISLAADSSAT